jgi:hypothetical protein
MDENLFSHCKLCNYRSDERLMLNVFDEQSGYAEKIELYLDLKVEKRFSNIHKLLPLLLRL